MKTILATAMIAAVGLAGIYLWHAEQSREIDVSFRQIYIHDTPVCLIRQDGEFIASIGLCDAYGEESPEYRDAPSGLPPGHPPVDTFPGAEPLRNTPI